MFLFSLPLAQSLNRLFRPLLPINLQSALTSVVSTQNYDTSSSLILIVDVCVPYFFYNHYRKYADFRMGLGGICQKKNVRLIRTECRKSKIDVANSFNAAVARYLQTICFVCFSPTFVRFIGISASNFAYTFGLKCLIEFFRSLKMRFYF